MRIGRVCVVLLAVVPIVSAADDRAADRAAIRADIDGIYQAFIHKDRAKCRRRTTPTGTASWKVPAR